MATGKSMRSSDPDDRGSPQRPGELDTLPDCTPLAISKPAPPAGPEWSHNLPIYEVNLREYTPEGTFKAFEQHLPAIKELGVGIIWFMPIHPLGEDERSFGSPYCVRDYLDVNSEYGTKQDFNHLVEKIHELGMYVMMDWVPHHSSWDNPLISEHPEWYKKDANGNIVQARRWTDVASFDYTNFALWEYMADACSYWIREFGIDGFRCDVAWGVPVEHWIWLRAQIQESRRQLFMLAEANDPRYHLAFDVTYDWHLPPLMRAIAKGEKSATLIDDILAAERKQYPLIAVRMRFTYNHDYNWEWRLSEQYGGGIKAFAVLCATLPGKPLVLNGQEVGLDRRLPMSTRGPRQPIEWVDNPFRDFYTRLLNLYEKSRALFAGEFIKVKSSQDDNIYAYLRRHGDEKVLIVLNLSDKTQRVTLHSDSIPGDYQELFTETRASFAAKANVITENIIQ